jgi:hypothetical protein
MFPNPFPFTLYNVTAETPTPPSPTGDYCYGGDWVQGKVGNYGMSFDGTNEYVAVNTLATSMQGKNTFSVAFWASGSAYGADPAAFVLSDGGVSSETFALYPYDNSGGNGFRVFYNGTSIINENDATRTGWNYFAYVQNGATDHKIYVNGQQEGTSITSKTLDAQLDLSGIGGEGTLAEYFSGDLDEVAVWNVPLSASDITSLYNSGNGAVASSISSSNLLLYYDFEIGESNPVSGNFPTSTTVYDASLTHTGTMTNMEVADFGSWEQGRIGKYSLKFIYNTSDDGGGTSLNSTYVDIGGTVTDFARTDAYSISGWLKPNYGGSEADRCDVFANNVGGQFPQGWYVLAFQKKVYFFFGTSGTAYIVRQTNTAVLDTTDWVHFTITYNGNSLNTGIKIYINGSEAASTGGSAGTFNGTVNYSSARLRIGGMANGYNIFHRFPGNMDELAVWDVELDSGAASALYNGALANSVSSSNLVAYYDMETDGPGNLTLQDLSTNAISGSMINMSSGSCGAG